MVMKKDWKYLWMILPVCLFLHTSAQSVTIGNIFIQGNRKTKTYIVERELSFKKGDTVTISQLVNAFHTAHDRLINTHLFNEVLIYVKDFSGYKVNVEIEVKERWYIFPVPYFKPVDRNFTAWSQKHYSLSRVNYGGKFTHYNFTGRNDNLTAWLITGYARQFELYYNQPPPLPCCQVLTSSDLVSSRVRIPLSSLRFDSVPARLLAGSSLAGRGRF